MNIYSEFNMLKNILFCCYFELFKIPIFFALNNCLCHIAAYKFSMGKIVRKNCSILFKVLKSNLFIFNEISIVFGHTIIKKLRIIHGFQQLIFSINASGVIDHRFLLSVCEAIEK